MGTIATIYGCIFCYGGPRREELARTNQEALRSLPEEDRYPPLTRNMFALTATDYPQPGFYKYQMIHFGASLKEDGEEWDVWLKKFERLLARLEWDKAELHGLRPGVYPTSCPRCAFYLERGAAHDTIA